MKRVLSGCLLFLFFFHPGFASADTRTVEIPLTLEFPLVRSMVIDKIYTSPGDRLLLEDPDWCATIELWDPQVFPVQTSLGIRSKIRFQSGFRIGSTCFNIVNWTGEIEIIQSLRLDKGDWQIKFKTEDSFIYDQKHKRPFLAGIFWDYAKGYLHSTMDQMRIDLSSPVKELKELLPLFFAETQMPKVQSWLNTLRPGEVLIQSDAVRSRLMMEVDVSPAVEKVPEITPSDIEAMSRNWEAWDAFFVREIETLIGRTLEQGERREILDTLLSMRYSFTQALSGNTLTQGLINTQFTNSWDRISKILRKYLLQESSGSLLRHLAFFTAADALAIVEKLGPAVGIEMTPQGLRRLASLLGEEGKDAGLVYSYELDPRLRELLGLGPPLPESGPSFDVEEFESPVESEEMPPKESLWHGSFLRLASAGDRAPGIPAELREWIPPQSQGGLPQYLDKVHQVLQKATEETLSKNQQPSKVQPLYRLLVLATAWQESCWRQLEKKRDKVTYLLSYNRTSVGLMQINERVWRGLYQRDSLRWDIRYNARAGAEILDLYMQDYALTRMEAQSLSDETVLARAVYAMYNAGPDELQRFLKRYRSNSPHDIDRLFMEKFEMTQKGEFEKIAICLIGTAL